MSSWKILLGDDENLILDSVSLALSDWARERGVALLTAPSAEEGWKLLETENARTALIVSDMRMPGMKGSDFLLRVRALYPEIVAILFSGYSDIPEIRNAITSGIFSFLLKPCEIDLLRAEIEKALEIRQMREERLTYIQKLEEELRWGGDYYDIIPLPDGKYLYLIGDVSGHGIQGAFVTAMLKAWISNGYINRRRGLPVDPADLLITFAACLLDPGAMSLAYANAGHVPPCLVRDGGTIRVHAEGMALASAGRDRFTDDVTVVSMDVKG